MQRLATGQKRYLRILSMKRKRLRFANGIGGFCLFLRSERFFQILFQKWLHSAGGGSMRKQNFAFSQRAPLTSQTADPVTPLKGRPHEDDHSLWSLARAVHTPLPRKFPSNSSQLAILIALLADDDVRLFPPNRLCEGTTSAA